MFEGNSHMMLCAYDIPVYKQRKDFLNAFPDKKTFSNVFAYNMYIVWNLIHLQDRCFVEVVWKGMLTNYLILLIKTWYMQPYTGY